MRPETPIRRDRPIHGASKDWRFFKTAAGPDETEYPEEAQGVNVYYARELRNVSYPKEVGAQTLTYEETERFNYVCNLEPEKYIEEGSVVLGFLENGRWWTIDKVIGGFHLFDRVTWSPESGLRVTKVLLPSAAPNGGWPSSKGSLEITAHALARSDEHMFGVYARWDYGLDPIEPLGHIGLGVGLVKMTPELSEVWSVTFDDALPKPDPITTRRLIPRSVAATPDGVTCTVIEVDFGLGGLGIPTAVNLWVVCDADGVVLGHGKLDFVGGANGTAATGFGPRVVCDGEKFYVLDGLSRSGSGPGGFFSIWEQAYAEISADGVLVDRGYIFRETEPVWFPSPVIAIEAAYSPATGDIHYRASTSNGAIQPSVMRVTPGEWIQRQSPGTFFGRLESIDVGPDGTVYGVRTDGSYISGGLGPVFVPAGHSRLFATSPDGSTTLWHSVLDPNGPTTRVGAISITPDASKIYMLGNPEPTEGQGYAVFDATDGTRLGTHDLEYTSGSQRALALACVVARDDVAVFGHEHAK